MKWVLNAGIQSVAVRSIMLSLTGSSEFLVVGGWENGRWYKINFCCCCFCCGGLGANCKTFEWRIKEKTLLSVESIRVCAHSRTDRSSALTWCWCIFRRPKPIYIHRYVSIYCANFNNILVAQINRKCFICTHIHTIYYTFVIVFVIDFLFIMKFLCI